MAELYVTRLDPANAERTDNPIFVGTVAIEGIVTQPDAESLVVTSVTFVDGARNRPHRHSTDQVLVATAGRGYVASDEGELAMEPGDVAFIPRGTRHWHGAAPETMFSHLSIVTRGHTQIDE